jgi:uncharacterized protein (DUF1015 family)
VGLFREDFEEHVLADVPDYQADFETPGRYGRIVKVDFRVQGKRSVSLLQTLSTVNPTAAHQVANEVFTKWYDLQDRQTEFQFLTIYDSNISTFRDSDLKRMEEVSTVLAFPAQTDAIVQVLVA